MRIKNKTKSFYSNKKPQTRCKKIYQAFVTFFRINKLFKAMEIKAKVIMYLKLYKINNLLE